MEAIFTLLIPLTIFILSGFKIDREYERGVIFRLGRMNSIKGPGLYWTIPLVDQKAKIDIRTKTVDIKSQETITADSVTVKVNAVLYYRILDADRAINKIENYEVAVYQASMTTLRNVLGKNILDDILRNRDKMNIQIQEIVDEISEPWGVVIERVEMKDVEIPQSMQRAMAQEAEAVREKRARVIKASAEKEASLMLSEASEQMCNNPIALELRRLQTLTEIGAENNTTTVMLVPTELITLTKEMANKLAKENGK
ncbi:MAG: slipin family protein [Cyanobacteria bacterium]|nr:slipin family protein [Cyanobacteria bacterium CG_2015-16_32_12]NCO79514.1 slipin family protein [Cyanobacteria bacterium CG_2015-22_32_23]NCQ04550.1 slipin family protein [Cyanobacteria bacterium CG_2015-09_32_10]NCQ40473.1 slipin family protein [Cyanobacteria bacterium CG_2015-04_32_10]NCS84558.1 slipin family protein [Cyanobacteria bacterium CG_2015-02_32_10]